MLKRKFNVGIIGASLALASVSVLAANDQSNYIGFANPTKGVEFGFEHQKELVDGEDFVQRVYGRAQRTYDWEVYKDASGNTIDVEAKGGVMLGRYKGSEKPDGISEKEYGSYVYTDFGVTGDATALYTLNTGRISPVAGLKGEVAVRRTSRIEYQADALAGVKFAVAGDSDLTLRYGKTLVHGISYLETNEDYRQDDGYSVALIGTKRMPNKTSHTLKLEYEYFEKGDTLDIDDNWIGFEPPTTNWLLSYKKTF